jgi:hypothetical protein
MQQPGGHQKENWMIVERDHREQITKETSKEKMIWDVQNVSIEMTHYNCYRPTG